MTMDGFVRDSCTMIAAAVQGDVDGIPKGSHQVRVPPPIATARVSTVTRPRPVEQRLRLQVRRLPSVRSEFDGQHVQSFLGFEYEQPAVVDDIQRPHRYV